MNPKQTLHPLSTGHNPHPRASLPCPLQVLQHELRKTHAKSQQIEWLEELSLFEIVGKGGFGVVYKGSWKGSVAAIKVRREHLRVAPNMPKCYLCV